MENMEHSIGYGPYELVDNVDYGSHQQALTWLTEHYVGPLNVATGYVGLEGLDALARVTMEWGGGRSAAHWSSAVLRGFAGSGRGGGR